MILTLENVRVVTDPNQVFIIGTDVMYGKEDTILPWTIMLSGQVKIFLRGEGMPWTVTVPLTVPEARKYRAAWDSAPNKPKPRARGQGGRPREGELPPPPPR